VKTVSLPDNLFNISKFLKFRMRLTAANKEYLAKVNDAVQSEPKTADGQ
jgi:hypothetical protein